LAAGEAAVSIRRAPQIEHEGMSISLIPSNPKASGIVVDARNGFPIVSLVLGKSTPLEVVWRDEESGIAEVRAICDAVIKGRFQEDLMLAGSEATKSVGTIEVGGQKRVFRYYGQFYPLKKKRIHISYSPY
jgi:hypothetical protein